PLFTNDTLFAPLLLSDTEPEKLFALPKVITPAPALIVAAPAVVIAPVCVRPTLVKVSAPEPSVEVPMLSAFTSVSATAFAPELFNNTEPVKLLLALVSVIVLAP